MKKVSKKLLMLFAVVLCLSVAAGAALAYFSDYEAAAGGATLNLGGQTELSEGENHAAKDITIKNTGKTNMIVRVALIGEGVQYFKNEPTYNKNDWEKVEEDGVVWYYYKNVLKPEETTSNILAKMEFSWTGDEPDYSFELTVVHESAQAVYNGKTLAAPEGWNQSIVEKIGKDGE